MAVTFRILAEIGLVYVRYTGIARGSEGMDLFRDYMNHPDARPGQKHLVDLTAVEGVEPDYADIMKFQALKAEHFGGHMPQTMVAYLAPTLAGQNIANFAIRSWGSSGQIVARVFVAQEAALNFLGVPLDDLETALNQTDLSRRP